MALHGAVILSADTQLFVRLTKSDPFWITDRSSKGRSRVSSAPFLAHPSVHQCGDDPSFTQVLDNAGAVSRRQLQDLNLLRCPVQSKIGSVVELQHMEASCSACSNKNFLTILPGSCSKRLCLTREKGWVLRNLLLWWCWWFTLSLWPYTKLPWHKRHTHNTFRLLQLHWNRFQASKESTPTLTPHGNAVALSHVLKWLVD